MTNSTKEVLPERDAIDALLCKVVRPKLEMVAKDSGRGLEISTAVMQGTTKVLDLGLVSVGANDLQIIHGSMRLRFRKVFGERLLMHCEVLFEPTDAVNNCSGFSLKAEIKAGTTKRTAWTMRYSVWDWTDW